MFLFKGIDEKGEIRVGTLEANDRSEAFRLLKLQGIKPIELKETIKKKSIRSLFSFGVSNDEISYLLLRLSIMLSSGLTLTQALSAVYSQTENRRIAHAIMIIKEEIERGASIAQAFRKAEIFPEFLVEMLKVAERGKNLEQILTISSEFLNRTSDIKSRVFSSLTYPLFVILLSLLSVVAVMNLIIPKIAQVLTGLGKELPLVTKLVLYLANSISYSLYLLPILILLFLYRYKIFKRASLSRLMIKIPLIGKVIYCFNLSRFSRMLNMSLSSGIPIIRSLELSIASMSNYYMRESLKDVAKEVAKGKSISLVLADSKIFPEMFVNLINTGEKSGELEKILIMLSEIYDRQAMGIVNLWLRLIEPLAILIIGLIVAFIVLSVILPLSEISTGIKR